MSKGGENQAQSNQNAALQNQSQLAQELASLSQEYGDQYTTMVLPQLQKLYPELMSTVQGGSSPLTEAAQAPVQAATNSAINTALQTQGGLVNPDALYKDIAVSGQQNSGLAADQTLSSALAALQNLFSGQSSLAESGLSGTNAAAGQEGNVAGSYGTIAQQDNPWNTIGQIISAGAEAYGASQGAGAARSTGAAPSSGAQQSPTVSTPSAVTTAMPQASSTAPSLQDAYNAMQNMAVAANTPSTPVSQAQKPATAQNQQNPLSLSYYG